VQAIVPYLAPFLRATFIRKRAIVGIQFILISDITNETFLEMGREICSLAREVHTE
jgi:hypothetical protein